MNQIFNINVPGLNLLFSQFVNLEYKFLWIVPPDHSRQIYIGPAYEKIWGRPCEELYNDIASWHTSLLEDDREKTVQALKSRQADTPEDQRTVFCRIYDAAGNLRFTKDTCFHLFNPAGQVIAVAGIVEAITQLQWETESTQNSYQKKDQSCLDLSTILDKEFNLSTIKQDSGNSAKALPNFSNETAKLTSREKECLFELSSGKSAKRIARALSISPRTVEVHIDNIKRKLECRTRLEIVSKLNNLAVSA